MLVNHYGTFQYTNKYGTVYELNKQGIVNTKTNQLLRSMPAGMSAALQKFAHQPTNDFMDNIVTATALGYLDYGETVSNTYRTIVLHYDIAETLFKIAYNHGCIALGTIVKYDNNFTMRNMWTTFEGLQRLSPCPTAKQLAKKFNNYLNNYSTTPINKNTTLNELSHIFCGFSTFCSISAFIDLFPHVPVEWLLEHAYELKNIFTQFGEKGLEIYIYYWYTAHYSEYSQLSAIIRQYLSDCKFMNITPIKATNGIREMIEMRKTAQAYEEKQKDQGFAQAMSPVKEKLKFEYGDFTVVIPEKPADLVTEGMKMHHCVGSYVNTVIKQNCYIVFVRHKFAPSEPYITAQIYPNGRIGQYFLAYDTRISSIEDREFREAYQRHLFSLF